MKALFALILLITCGIAQIIANKKEVLHNNELFGHSK
jgi:hypothetical protein